MSRPGSKRALRRHHAKRLQLKRARKVNRTWFWSSSEERPFVFYHGYPIANPFYWEDTQWSRMNSHRGLALLGRLRDKDNESWCSCDMCSWRPRYRTSRLGKWDWRFELDTDSPLSYYRDYMAWRDC